MKYIWTSSALTLTSERNNPNKLKRCAIQSRGEGYCVILDRKTLFFCVISRVCDSSLVFLLAFFQKPKIKLREEKVREREREKGFRASGFAGGGELASSDSIYSFHLALLKSRLMFNFQTSSNTILLPFTSLPFPFLIFSPFLHKIKLPSIIVEALFIYFLIFYWGIKC